LTILQDLMKDAGKTNFPPVQ